MKRKAKVPEGRIPKYIPNPEYQGSEEQREEAAALAMTLEDYWSMMPDECGCKIPPEGCWIMVKRPPNTEFTVPPFSMWYALEDVRPRKSAGIYREDVGLAYHLAKILTPRGDLWLWPGEYVPVKDVSKYFEFPEEHIHINLLGGEELAPDKLFYIRSRGISKKDAIKMLIGEVKTQNIAYVTVHPAYARMFGHEMPSKERLAFTEEWQGEPAPA